MRGSRARLILSDYAKGKHRGAKRRQIRGHVSRSAQHLALVHEIDHGHRSFRRKPRGRAPHVAVQHEIARHGNPAAAQSLRNPREFSAVNCHREMSRIPWLLKVPVRVFTLTKVRCIRSHSSRDDLIGATFATFWCGSVSDNPFIRTWLSDLPRVCIQTGLFCQWSHRAGTAPRYQQRKIAR